MGVPLQVVFVLYSFDLSPKPDIIVTTQTSPLLCRRMGVWGVWRSRSDRHTPQIPAHIVETTTFGPYPAVIPEVEGAAYITGRHEFLIDPRDPLGRGFLLR